MRRENRAKRNLCQTTVARYEGEKGLLVPRKTLPFTWVRLALVLSATVQNELKELGRDHVIQANVLVHDFGY